MDLRTNATEPKKQLKNSIPTLAVREYEPSATQESQRSCILCDKDIKFSSVVYIIINHKFFIKEISIHEHFTNKVEKLHKR
jgi:hypothetical protein